ncbi:peptide chain release factor N(5)-glutamine methyltransferase [Pseudomonas matsuisoli]|uniref:Release factor glutamine methyltransferase n=1 Tax=Pseudomonas matsuisoli TaxID=1515666 RepID=A0A917PV02_9PSED|nr:peptide chain release factor N(5)-glutamine methyltransferase [Pseudomonas matsuisoli]GGJ92942.1 release factor glutamine methyltransferase [Pseudomonas matsuisoli]
MSTIAAALAEAQLPASATARLDAEILLSHVLGKTRSYLRTWPEKTLDGAQALAFERLIERRREGEPIAYLIGHQGFWTLDLEVAPDTLIPRPDTELLVETALSLRPDTPGKVLDLGTGTGAIALALAVERRHWQLTGVDRMPGAVSLAERNRCQHAVKNARFLCSDWFSALAGERFELIVSNPPYIAKDDHHLDEGDVRYEPRSALVAGDDGLDDIRLIVGQAPAYLQPGGWLLLEHGFDQAEDVAALLVAQGFQQISSRRDLAGHPRITLGSYPL